MRLDPSLIRHVDYCVIADSHRGTPRIRLRLRSTQDFNLFIQMHHGNAKVWRLIRPLENYSLITNDEAIGSLDCCQKKSK